MFETQEFSQRLGYQFHHHKCARNNVILSKIPLKLIPYVFTYEHNVLDAVFQTSCIIMSSNGYKYQNARFQYILD